MGKFTIDQILADKYEEETPSTFEFSKEASATTTETEAFSNEEIEKMAGYLETAAVSESETSINEKIANAVIITETLQKIAEDTHQPTSLEERVVPSKEQGIVEKLAHFKKFAIEAGHTPEEVEAFIEKKSGVAATVMRHKGKILAGLGVTGLATTTGVLGVRHGRKLEKENDPLIYRAGLGRGYRVGRQHGSRKGFARGYMTAEARLRRKKQEG